MRRANVMNIEGLGEAMVSQLMGHPLNEPTSLGGMFEAAASVASTSSMVAEVLEEAPAEEPTRKALVRTVADLYRLTEGDLVRWSGWA